MDTCAQTGLPKWVYRSHSLTDNDWGSISEGSVPSKHQCMLPIIKQQKGISNVKSPLLKTNSQNQKPRFAMVGA